MSGKDRSRVNLVLDTIMFLAIISVFTIKGEAHEGLGYTLGILATVHILLHWKQIKVMYRQF